MYSNGTKKRSKKKRLKKKRPKKRGKKKAAATRALFGRENIALLQEDEALG